MRYNSGAVYGNSERKVYATARVNEFGDTIFFNEGTGHDCIVINGHLYSANIAKQIHDELIVKAAPKMLEALNEALEFVADHEDVVDGDYGEPAPNRAMQLATVLRAIISEAEG